MSIYPVRLSEWFPPGDEHHETMKFMVEYSLGCLHCKKKRLHWQQVWGHHSIPWGYGDMWCREKCYRNWKKKRIKNG